MGKQKKNFWQRNKSWQFEIMSQFQKLLIGLVVKDEISILSDRRIFKKLEQYGQNYKT